MKQRKKTSGAFLKILTTKAYEEGRILDAVRLSGQWSQVEKNAETYFNHALLSLESGNANAALQALNQALALQPDYEEAAIEKALILFDMRHWAEALAVCENLLNSGSYAPWSLVSMIHNELGRTEEALFYAQKAIAQTGGAWDYQARAFAYERIGKKELALADFKEALRIENESAEIWNNLAIFYENEEQYSEALTAYAAALKTESANSSVRFNRAKLYQQLGYLQEACNDCQAALDDSPSDAEGWNLYGNILSDMQQPDKALNAYNKAIELDNGNINIIINRAFCLDDLGRDLEAEKEYKKILKQDETDSETRVALVEFYIKQGRLKEAAKTLEKGLEIDPSSAILHSAVENLQLPLYKG